ncbi:SH3 and multiple ankyrin repeat domains protein 3 isoform X4 [Cotesia glomerata]|uniref:SH3 and multiple ankyrin repeat domains protein 3 isoform X4 n=1 Tax=Cotesia glomerata TaxID=32391 RepID=UPI001D02F984|nr:SH3 and multiple ankyrin repeat domains protein 3 isoform X4 [Cotesia glomerata]
MEAGPRTGICPSGGQAGNVTAGQAQFIQAHDPALEAAPAEDGILFARVNVPELNVTKCLQFPKDQLVWDVKQQCLASLPKEVATWYRELKESFNYGLFCPPVNGKAGKFLDEERRLGDYPFNGPVGHLELKYKRRVYKTLHLDEKQLKALHTRSNYRRLIEYVTNSQVEKISKMCNKGLDPNFHDIETGETPLTLATNLKKPTKVIIALVNGGALLDYRTKEGLTAMHRAVERNNKEAVKTLLELGASPNYKDTKGLTPLYYSVIYKADEMICNALLHDHATIGAEDLQGWQEIHHACRNNLVRHLDHLLYYGADMNARNASGNTPLHVCAVNNTDASCIRTLLFRGAQKDSLNYANQTPYQVAVIAGNMELAEVIKTYQAEDVVPLKDPPSYNPKRRSVAFAGMTTSCSASNLGTLTRIPSSTESSTCGTLTRTISVDQYSSGTLSRLPMNEHYSSSITSSSSSSSSSRIPSGSEQYMNDCLMARTPSAEQQYSSASMSRVSSEEHQYSGISRAESHHSSLNRVPSIEQPRGGNSTGECGNLQRIPSEQLLVSTMVRLPPQSYCQNQQGHNNLNRNNNNNNTSNNINNHNNELQNTLNRLPSEYQTPSLRDPHVRSPNAEHYQNLRIEGLTRLHEHHHHRFGLQHRLDIQGRMMEMPPSPSPSSRSFAPFSSASSSLSEGSNQPSGEDSASIVTDKSLGDTASDIISDSSGVGTSQSDTTNSLSIPGTTVVCVESYNSGIAGHLTINQGDILEVTGATDCGLLEGVLRGQGTGLFPAHCVQEVRLRHTNIPLGPQHMREGRNRVIGRREAQQKYFATAPRLKKPICMFSATSEPRSVILHRSKKGFGFILRGAKTTPSTLVGLAPAAQYLDDVSPGGVADLAGLRKGDFLIQINGEDVSTASHEHVVDLIRKSGELVRMTVVSPVNLPNSQSTATLPTSQPTQRQYATLPRKGSNNVPISGTLGRSPAPMPPRRDPKTTLSVGRARARSMVAGLEGGGEKDDRDEIGSTGGKSSSAESIHLAQQSSTSPNTGQNTPVQPRTASIRSRPTSSRITAAELQSNSRVRFFGGLGGGSDLHRDFHSTPDLNIQGQSSALAPKGHRSQEDVNALSRNGLPPPNHPPPPPPVGQVIKVNVGANVPDVVTPASVYDNMAHIQQVKELAAASESNYGIMSSFRPANNAKLYASPEDTKTVGYRSHSLPGNPSRTHLRKSHSLRTSNNGGFNSQNGQQIANGVINSNNNGALNASGCNQYAQPLKTNRSHSIASTREAKKKTISTSASASNLSGVVSGPPIPEPDYSLSESENEDDEEEEFEVGESEIAKELEKAAAREKFESTRETSGNSNASGSSSSGSSSLPHSFSVEEIQKVRTQLKSSKSHPNEFLLSQQTQQLVEDGDNSSSGVSSDQDVPVGPPTGFDDTTRNDSNNQSIVNAEKENNHKRMNYSSGMLTRHAVSLAQLPPPIEADAEEQNNDLFVPPPPEFNAGPSAGQPDNSELVFAPPPQFSDNRQQQTQNRVKIIGAIPKVVGNNQVKPPSGRLHSQ